MKSNKEELILSFIFQNTEFLLKDSSYDISHADAFSISIDFSMERSNVSRILNSHWKQNTLIKLKGRPTLYLSREVLEKYYSDRYIPSTISKDKSIWDYLDIRQNKDPFSSLLKYPGFSENETLYDFWTTVLHRLKTPLSNPVTLVHSKSGVSLELLYSILDKQFTAQLNLNYIKLSAEDFILQFQTYQNLITRIHEKHLNSNPVTCILDACQWLCNDAQMQLQFVAFIRYLLRDSYRNHFALSLILLWHSADSQDIPADFKPYSIAIPEYPALTYKEKMEWILFLSQRECNFLQKNLEFPVYLLEYFCAYQANTLDDVYAELRQCISNCQLQHSDLLSINLHCLSANFLNSLDGCTDSFTCIKNISQLIKEKSLFFIPGTENDYYLRLLENKIDTNGFLLQSEPSENTDVSSECSVLPILLASYGESIAEKHAIYINSFKYSISCFYIDFPKAVDEEAMLSLLYQKAREIDSGNGILLIVDDTFPFDIVARVRKETADYITVLFPLSLPLIFHVIEQMESSSFHVDMVQSTELSSKANPVNSFQDKEIMEVLSNSLVFLDCHKAVENIYPSLVSICQQLELPISYSLLIKYLFHCAFMIERVIRNEPLAYKKLASMSNLQEHIFAIVEKNIQSFNNTFSIAIPASETARLSEIFEEYLLNVENEEAF
ncbi:Transcriptional antiterminator [uncultured Clostridium sp.]|nr:Transcriptional antiterminator [uncultured Clostridium sp.]